MLGKVRLRRNDFLFFQSERYLKRYLKSQIRRLQLDYLSVLSVFVASEEVFFGKGIISSYVEYW